MIPSKFTVANGNVTDVYQSGNSIVALDKVLKFPRGKVKPWTDELMQEQDSLIALRKADQKAFAADPDLKKRLKALDDLEYNF